MCTRIVYRNKNNNNVITGRNFDWVDWSEANIWAYPSGLKRNGSAGKNSVEWTSLYKSVTAASFDQATADGMNEKGLVANLLWLAKSEYPMATDQGNSKALSIGAWAQYILDLCKDVPEAIKAMKEVYVATGDVPGTDKKVECHLSVSDKDGNSVIFEYTDGELKVYSNVDGMYTKEQVDVMTNEPTFADQLTLCTYWNNIDGRIFLPGSCQPSDRFVRATFYNKQLPRATEDSGLIELSGALSVMRNVVEPFEDPSKLDINHPNVSPTQYTTLSDHKSGIYYFAPAQSPFLCWIKLSEIQFSGSNALKIEFETNGFPMYQGNVKDSFKSQKAFDFLPVQQENLAVLEAN